MHLIQPRLYLGDLRDAHSIKNLKSHGITAIMNCTMEEKFIPMTKDMYRARVAVDDDLQRSSTVTMTKALPEVVKWISEMLKSGKTVLVHCYAGQQRSACAIAAYLMSNDSNMSVSEAIEFVRRKKPDAFRPYANFRAALNGYKKVLTSKSKR